MFGFYLILEEKQVVRYADIKKITKIHFFKKILKILIKN